ncbi:SDR family oxidoreductase [Pseudomonas aeruginosa]|nr:SDR family oxidoreductase [Pseudomonas aeruginosa]MDF5955335.1 SDR family oxidoreductase [Pseudomonas aeruginosa]
MGFGKPEDIANAAIFMLSDASRWVTGTTLVMDGGLTIS